MDPLGACHDLPSFGITVPCNPLLQNVLQFLLAHAERLGASLVGNEVAHLQGLQHGKYLFVSMLYACIVHLYEERYLCSLKLVVDPAKLVPTASSKTLD
jgi:hypothetical protein